MKFQAILATILFALTACTGASKRSDDASTVRNPSSELTHQCVAKMGPSCRAKIRWICAEGFHDACTDDSSGLHRCVPDIGGSCNLRIMHHCPDHFVNGCNTGASKAHTCVAAEGSSCAQEIAMDCPAGFVDRCLIPDNEWDGPRNND